MKKLLNIICSLFAIFILTVSVYANDWVNMKLTYDGKVHNYSAEKIYIHIDNKPIENMKMEPVIINGRTLVPIREIFEEMGAEVIWKNKEREAIIKLYGNEISFKIDSKEIVKNNIDIIQIDVPAKIINDYTMVPIRAISDSIGCSVVWDNAIRTIFIETPIDTESSTQVIDKVTETTTIIEDVQTAQTTQNANISSDKIKIVWDQTSKKTNDTDAKRVAINGLDVLSPTWFSIKNDNGDIEDKGSVEYSKWAKEQGYQVWGLVTNSFDAKITHNTLSNKQKRSKIIDSLVGYAKKYDLDGINIDFESIDKKDGEHYLQFIKEATEVFKQNNLIVSVDMYMPTPWTAHYNMAEVAKVVDYVIIMAYDEHYRTSKVSGSVASLPWVEKGMREALKVVPKDKLIMGIPFYTRVWTETKNPDGSVDVVSKSLTMDEAMKLVNDNNVTIVWDEKARQNYAEYTSNKTVKKIWLEDEKSIEERMKLATELDVKGVACWKRGHENSNTWDIINKFMP